MREGEGGEVREREREKGLRGKDIIRRYRVNRPPVLNHATLDGTDIV